MKNSEKKKKLTALNTRRGVMLIALLAVLILMINLITASYSWFKPWSETKHSMSYGFTGKVRSENCTMSTFKGEKLTDSTKGEGEYVNQIRYEIQPSTEIVTVPAGETQYFKTEIINQDTDSASDISLYIKSLPACTLAITYPGNSVRKFSAEQNDLYIIRDAYVKQKNNADVNGPGKLEIDWFVIAGNSSVTVNLGDLYLLYN